MDSRRAIASHISSRARVARGLPSRRACRARAPDVPSSSVKFRRSMTRSIARLSRQIGGTEAALTQQISSHSKGQAAAHAEAVVNELDPQYQRQAPKCGGVGAVA